MPGYRKSTKYSAERNGEIRSRLIDVLNNNTESMSMKEMQAQDMILNSLSTQKMARELNYLVDMGVVQKAQSRMKKSMVYKATAHLDKETDYFDY